MLLVGLACGLSLLASDPAAAQLGEVESEAEIRAAAKERQRLWGLSGELRVKGQYEEALEVAQRALEIDRELLADRPELIDESLEVTAELHEVLDQFDEAIALRKEVLQRRMTRHGDDHVSTVSARVALEHLRAVAGLDEQQREQYEKADELMATLNADFAARDFAAALKKLETIGTIRTSLFGETSLRMIGVHSDTARVRSAQGEARTALASGKKAYDTALAVLGPNHPQTAEALNLYGMMALEMGQYDEAASSFERAAIIFAQTRGEADPAYLNALNNGATVLKLQGRLEPAVDLFRRIATRRLAVNGDRHPAYALALNNLADAYLRLGHIIEAEALLTVARQIQTESLGEQNDETLTTSENLAGLYSRSGRLDRAEELMQSILAVRRERLGGDHPVTAQATNTLAAILYRARRYEEAEPLFREVLAIRRRTFGEAHPDTLVARNNLAYALKDQGDVAGATTEADQLLEQARTLGATSEVLAGALRLRGQLHLMKGEREQAVPLLREAIETYFKSQGPDGPETQFCKQLLEQALSTDP